MLPMTSPRTSSRVLLVADTAEGRGGAAPGQLPIRRFRIARLRFDGRPVTGASRFDHLKRSYD